MPALACRRVLAGDAAAEQGRHRGVVPAAGAQRAAPGDRQSGREGDPQLRRRGPRGPGRAGPAGRVDLPVPGARQGSDRGRGRRGRGRGLAADGAWVLGRVWELLEIGAAISRAAEGRRLDGPAAERVIFALTGQRALEPASKLAATRWVAERVFIEGCPGFSDDQAYRAMDFLLAALEEIASGIFWSVAHLLNLDAGIVFVDTTSTYWEMEVGAGLAEVAGEDGAGEDGEDQD